MQLDERKRKILFAIIREYLETGEPVGSRTISKAEDINLSSATIRNEMSDLEEIGLILQPHTSAGRIPSDRGYRLYVDEMMLQKDREINELKELLVEKSDKMDLVLKQTAKLLATNTNYATMISAPSIQRNKLKFIQLSRVGEKQILAVIVAEGNIIKNSMIPVNEFLNDETMLKLNILLNTNLNGLCMEDINLGLIASLKQKAGIYSEIISNILDEVARACIADKDLEIYTSGTNNILKYPELNDFSKASELLNTFEEKQVLSEFMDRSLQGESGDGIQIYIGDENNVQTMKDCSVVTVSYELEEGMRGTIGIVGPKRMDYEKVVDTLNTIKHQLDDLYKKK